MFSKDNFCKSISIAIEPLYNSLSSCRSCILQLTVCCIEVCMRLCSRSKPQPIRREPPAPSNKSDEPSQPGTCTTLILELTKHELTFFFYS